MTAKYHINDDDHLISLYFDGEVTLADVIELGEELLKDINFQPAWPQLIDLRDSSITPSKGISASLVDYINNSYHPNVDGSIAVVVNESISPDDCAAAYKLVCPLEGAEIFDDYAHAIRWLLRHGMMTLAPSLQHPDPRADNADKGPEQKRA